MSDDHRALVPPDPIPNSVVKRCIADGSVGFPHVRVGHRQTSIQKPSLMAGFFLFSFPIICSPGTAMVTKDILVFHPAGDLKVVLILPRAN